MLIGVPSSSEVSRIGSCFRKVLWCSLLWLRYWLMLRNVQQPTNCLLFPEHSFSLPTNLDPLEEIHVLAIEPSVTNTAIPSELKGDFSSSLNSSQNRDAPPPKPKSRQRLQPRQPQQQDHRPQHHRSITQPLRRALCQTHTCNKPPAFILNIRGHVRISSPSIATTEEESQGGEEGERTSAS